jgi:hypothetical protein
LLFIYVCVWNTWKLLIQIYTQHSEVPKRTSWRAMLDYFDDWPSNSLIGLLIRLFSYSPNPSEATATHLGWERLVNGGIPRSSTPWVLTGQGLWAETGRHCHWSCHPVKEARKDLFIPPFINSLLLLEEEWQGHPSHPLPSLLIQHDHFPIAFTLQTDL